MKEMKKELEIYIHIPFCLQKCKYCDFLSSPAEKEVQDVYMNALWREIAGRSEEYREYRVVTVFIGGGTPTAVEPMWISRILGLLRQEYDLDEDAEITMEMNPGTVTERALEIYKASGVNRLSIGLQSANNEELKNLGRIHTYEQFLVSFRLAREAGFDNINVDIMSALPGQSFDSYTKTLDMVTGLVTAPEHISAYSLIIEEGTPFYEAYEAGGLDLPEEECERRMYAYTEEFLRQKGYVRYEISNYAKAGKECRHNIGYWERREYLGFGIGAASLVDNRRFSNTVNRESYIAAPLEGYGEIQVLSRAEQMEETMFLGLRMMRGVSEEQFERSFGISLMQVYGEVIQKHVGSGLLQRKKEDGEHWIVLTAKGMDVSNHVMADFLEPVLF